jgi:hypothetical protein
LDLGFGDSNHFFFLRDSWRISKNRFLRRYYRGCAGDNPDYLARSQNAPLINWISVFSLSIHHPIFSVKNIDGVNHGMVILTGLLYSLLPESMG